MDELTTIRSEIEKQLSRSGHTLASFAKLSGLNRGSLSAILHGNPPKPISLSQLDTITKSLGFPAGWLYPLYVGECFSEHKISRRRLEPFLIRCTELGKQSCIDEVLGRLLESAKAVDIVYSVGEKLFNSGKVHESVAFYRIVAEIETDSTSERLAISQFRIFISEQAVVDMEERLRTLIVFEPFRGRLPEPLQLEGLLRLGKVCFHLHRWEEMEGYGDELRALAQGIYRQELVKSSSNSAETLRLERPLVFYYGHGYLIKALALTKQGHYAEAKKYTAGYADLSWFKLLDDEGRLAVEKFSIYAAANSFALELLGGNISVLSVYTAFLAENPGEILAGLIIIMQAANHYGFKADAILTRFSREIQRFEQFQDPINVERLYRLSYQTALYLTSHSQYQQAVQLVLQSLKLVIRLNNGKELIKVVILFEINREYADAAQLTEYGDIVKGLEQHPIAAANGNRHFGIM